MNCFRTLIILGLLMCNILPGAEPPLYPIYNQGSFGYMDAKGEIVIAPRFTRVDLFGDEGLALACLPNPTGSHGNYMQVFIDRLGNVIIGPGPPKQFSRYDIAMRDINEIGLEQDWEYSDFSNGRARIYDSRTESSGYIDTAGNLVIPVVYKFAKDFSEGIASVEHNSRPMLISKDGKKIASFAENISLGSQFREGFLKFSIQTGPSTWRWGYVGKNGQTVIKAQYSFASCFSGGIAAVCDPTSDKIGYLNTQGEIVIPFNYDDWTDSSDGVVFVRQGKTVYSLDHKGRVIGSYVPSGNDEIDMRIAEPTKGTLFTVFTRDGVRVGAILNSRCELMFPIEEVNVKGGFYEGLVFAEDRRTKEFGYLNKSGEWIYKWKGPVAW